MEHRSGCQKERKEVEEKDREGNVKGEKEERKEGGRERGYGKQKAENITQTAVVWRNHLF